MEAAPSPPEIDEELAQQLQEEEVVAEEAWLGRDAATLEVAIESTGLLTWGQVQGLGHPSNRWGALPGDWAKPAIHGCGGLATHSGDYLATPPT